MNKRKRVDEQHEFIALIKRRLFYLAAIVIALGELIDLFFIERNNFVVIVNITISAAMVISIVLYSLKIINVTTANALVVFFILADLLSSPYNRIIHPDFHVFFFRNGIVAFAIIPYASFVINKNQSIVVGALYYLNFLVLVLITKNQYLSDAIIVLTFSLIAFVASIYFLSSNLITALQIEKELLDESNNKNSLLRKQRSELKEAIDTKNKIFSIIAHDLRSPYNTILGFLKLMRKAIEEKNLEQIKKYHVTVEESSEQSYFLLENLLAWSSFGSNYIVFTPKDIKVKDLFAEIQELVQSDVEKKNISLTFENSEPKTISADPTMLSSILRNLITNAIKFTPLRGTIEVGANKKNDAALFFVRDNGVGLGQKELDELLAGKTIKSEKGTNEEKGSGLGLIICKEFVAKHKGKFWAKKNTGPGLTFFFTIPLKA